MTLKKSFGTKIQKLRYARGLTQEQLAEKISKSTGAIAKIENGERFPTYGTLEKLKSALMVTYSDLFNFENEPVIGLDRKIMYEISSLSPIAKEILYKFVINVLKDMKDL